MQQNLLKISLSVGNVKLSREVECVKSFLISAGT
jgi:hypothetical protein